MADLPSAVHDLDRDLRGIFSNRLRSLVAYGLQKHTSHGHEAPVTHTSVTHTLAVVDRLTADDLRACAARVSTWHDTGLATPLLIAEHEFERSLDAFPFEFGDILSDHVLVSGDSPFTGLTIDPVDLRRACEVQARGHLLHLREGYLETRGRSDALSVLIVRSAPAFAALMASLTRLDGAVPSGLTGTIATDIVALVGVHEISSADADRLFQPYLAAVERLVTFVDAWKPA